MELWNVFERLSYSHYVDLERREISECTDCRASFGRVYTLAPAAKVNTCLPIFTASCLRRYVLGEDIVLSGQKYRFWISRHHEEVQHDMCLIDVDLGEVGGTLAEALHNRTEISNRPRRSASPIVDLFFIAIFSSKSQYWTRFETAFFCVLCTTTLFGSI
jgi:hypothetical protein